MREDFETYADAEEPLLREGAGFEDEVDVEQELRQAVQAEFRESPVLPGEPLS